LSRNTTDLLVIARQLQRAGADIRSIAEPFLDTTSDFAEIVFATLALPRSWNAAAQWSARHEARRREDEGRQIRAQAETHYPSAARSAEAAYGR
jgi:DNA invertase Pin-like site-specific DNA recombinase